MLAQQPSLVKKARQLGLLVAFIVGIPLLAIGTTLAYQNASKSAIRSLADRAPLVVQLLENDIAAKVQTLSHAAHLLKATSVDQVSQTQLDNLVSDFSGVAWAGIADLNGKVVRDYPSVLKGADVSARPWFVEGRKQASVMDKHEALLLAKLLPQRSEPYHFIDIAVPVKSPSGSTIGVLALHLDWMWYETNFPRLLGKRSEQFSAGYFVFGADNSLRLMQASPLAQEIALQAAKEGGLSPRLLDGLDMVAQTGPQGGYLQSLGWKLYAVSDGKTHREAALSTGLYVLFAFVMGVLCAWWVFVIMSKRLSAASSQFIAQLARQSVDSRAMKKLSNELPVEMAPLATKAIELIDGFKNKQLQTQRALATAQASYLEIDRLIEQAPLAVAMFDCHMRYLACSRKWQKTYLPNSTEPVGHSHYELAPDMPEAWRKACQLGLSGQVVSRQNDYWKEASGVERWINWVVQPWLDHTGQLGGLIIVTEDVTQANVAKVQLAESEGRFQLAMQGSHDGLWDWDIQSDVLYFSPSWKAMLGYRPSELTDSLETLEKLLHPEDTAQAKNAIEAAFADPNETSFNCSFRLRHRDGHWVNVLSRGIILRDEQGNAKRMTGTHLDRTEIDALQSELSAASLQAMAERQSNEMKSQFMATVSHEIRNPLNSVCGFARLIRDEVGEGNPELEKYSQYLLQTTDQLSLLLNDLLDFAKIEAGKFELIHGPFDLIQLTDGLAASANLLCREKRVVFEYSKRVARGNHYEGDASRLRQILQNLLSNAVKFTKEGEVSLRVVTKVLDDQHDQLLIEVSDSGIGISAEKLPQLFKPFSQVHNNEGREYGGTGLGLAIVKSLIEQMNGQVSCVSLPGQGSKFSLSVALPVVEVASKNSSAQSAQQMLGKTVLIADDSVTNRKVLEAFLSKRGHTVVCASDGAQALTCLQQQTFDFALLDMDMPHLSGSEVAQLVRQQHGPSQHVRLACISGNAMHSAEDLALHAGFERYFTKPINLDELLLLLHSESIAFSEP